MALYKCIDATVITKASSLYIPYDVLCAKTTEGFLWLITILHKTVKVWLTWKLPKLSWAGRTQLLPHDHLVYLVSYVGWTGHHLSNSPFFTTPKLLESGLFTPNLCSNQSSVYFTWLPSNITSKKALHSSDIKSSLEVSFTQLLLLSGSAADQYCTQVKILLCCKVL